ncbi:neural cell adhesion molecule 1 [Plakobranchus ocellatus]|uniref:Neural cell adhesion molecule 1 n=1 Tax=Plakobranchus ocellatus TaxID=259542 RepID=A0AAV4CG49_9GAST|nr:neural cell adhesion molecule 1 [Plakobranchus ocellatus]
MLSEQPIILWLEHNKGNKNTKKPVETFGSRFKIKEKSKALRVAPSRLQDSDNYTCIASNRHGNDTMVVEIIVFTMPQVEVLPSTHVIAVEGTAQEIKCRSRAVPKPTFSWITSQNERLKSGNPSDVSVPGRSAPSRYSIEEREVDEEITESVLTISEVSYLDQGLFVCYAENIGESKRVDIQVDVSFAPRPIVEQRGIQTVYFHHSKLSPPFTLSCGVMGNELPEISWVYNGNFLNTSHCHTDKNPPEIRSFACTVNETTMGNYKCFARNSHGQSLIQEFDVQPLYPPPPIQIEVDKVHANRIRVSSPLGLAHTPDPSYVFVTYRLQRKKGRKPKRWDMYETSVGLDSHGEAAVFLPGLKENAKYLVTATSKNIVGLSPETSVTIKTGLIASKYDDLVHVWSPPTESSTPAGHTNAQNASLQQQSDANNAASLAHNSKGKYRSSGNYSVIGDMDDDNDPTAFSILGRSGSTSNTAYKQHHVFVVTLSGILTLRRFLYMNIT